MISPMHRARVSFIYRLRYITLGVNSVVKTLFFLKIRVPYQIIQQTFPQFAYFKIFIIVCSSLTCTILLLLLLLLLHYDF
jgi:hypothetical protein